MKDFLERLVELVKSDKELHDATVDALKAWTAHQRTATRMLRMKPLSVRKARRPRS